MYNNRTNNNRGYRNNSQFNRNTSRSRHNNKTFDPTHIIARGFESKPVVEEEHNQEFRSFAAFPLLPELLQNIARKNYTVPTPIQDKSIMPMLQGRDIIGIANTGTGKTAAFLIPLIQKVLEDRHKKILIVAPTRELAVQIRDEFFGFARNLGIFSVLCIGGVNIFRQKTDLKRQFNFVIGTPGRLKDLIQGKNLDLSGFSHVVLDEADHMVDIGFIHDVKFLISHLPNDRQSLFFSATIDDKVKEILQAFVKNPVTVSVKKQDTAVNVKQDIVRVVNKGRKVDQLHDLLIKKEYEKVLIFGRTKWGVQKLSDELVRRGFKAAAIHGNKKQSQRQRTLDQFKRNDIQILLATDVASRGLDITDVSHVINFDMPATYEDYIHRIGRTGRANKNGIALTFVE